MPIVAKTSDSIHVAMNPLSSTERVRRSRERAKFISRGEIIPVSLTERKRGRKPTAAANTEYNAKKRQKYHSKAVKKVKGNVIKTLTRSTMVLRERKSYCKSKASSAAMEQILDWAVNLDKVDLTSLTAAKRTMNEILVDIGACFKWLQTYNNTHLLLYEERIEGESILHPWVEVKESPVIEGSTETLSYGLFAARKFPIHAELGIYVGKVRAINDGKESSAFMLNYKDRVLVDIDENEERLHFGMGSHMMNDHHYPDGQDCNDHRNNAIILSNLTIVAKHTIMKGEEICACYNYNI